MILVLLQPLLPALQALLLALPLLVIFVTASLLTATIQVVSSVVIWLFHNVLVEPLLVHKLHLVVDLTVVLMVIVHLKLLFVKLLLHHQAQVAELLPLAVLPPALLLVIFVTQVSLVSAIILSGTSAVIWLLHNVLLVDFSFALKLLQVFNLNAVLIMVSALLKTLFVKLPQAQVAELLPLAVLRVVKYLVAIPAVKPVKVANLFAHLV